MLSRKTKKKYSSTPQTIYPEEYHSSPLPENGKQSQYRKMELDIGVRCTIYRTYHEGWFHKETLKNTWNTYYTNIRLETAVRIRGVENYNSLAAGADL